MFQLVLPTLIDFWHTRFIINFQLPLDVDFSVFNMLISQLKIKFALAQKQTKKVRIAQSALVYLTYNVAITFFVNSVHENC